jgi:hypothetical protein
MNPNTVPGRTETFGEPCASLQPWRSLAAIPEIRDRRLILLSTATITEENIYMNGLFQNVFVFYRMFEAMGYAPIFVVNDRPKSLKEVPGPMRSCRYVVTEDLLRQPMSNLAAMIEIGMSIDPLVRQFVKMLGGRLFKVYLGNILNIDIETPIFMPNHHFAHHVVGRQDKILVSPHYGQHAEYATYLNQVVPPEGLPLEDLVAPYVWDPSVLTRNGTLQLQWRPAQTPEEEVFVIMEPNISFQKAATVPLLALERWYRDVGRAAGWRGRVCVVNGERLDMVPHAKMNFLPLLDLWRDGRIDLLGRMDVVSVLQTWPAATFMLHNYNNEFNYMTLELMWTGFPVVHNSPSWAAFGYSYDGADIGEAARQIESVRRGHKGRLEAYKGHAQLIAWRYSPYNPEVQAAWEKALNS